MIQIGEAGWFLPVGGTVIGGLRPDTGEFCYRVLSVEFFQGERFLDRQYVQEACNLTAEILSGLNVPKHTEPLQICSGNFTNYIQFWVCQQEYQYSNIQTSNQPQILLIQPCSCTCARTSISTTWIFRCCMRSRLWRTGCAGSG
jgi:hypothetical protein